MSYAGSRSGSQDNLDDRGGSRYPPAVAQPRGAPTPSERSYERQYTRNQPPNPGGGRELPPEYSSLYTDRYAERNPPRSHSPGRYERPQDQYIPSRSQSPGSYVDRAFDMPDNTSQPPRTRSQSPGRALDDDGYAENPRYAQGAPARGGYADYPQYPQGAPTRGGYAQSVSAYPSSAPQPRTYSTTSAPAYGKPSTSGSAYYPQKTEKRPYNGYSNYNKYEKPKHKSATRDGGYYNVYTDAVIKTKKQKTKGGVGTYLAVSRPWSKNHSNQPRDFMPLVAASIFFCPPIGIIALIISCMTKSAVTRQDWAKAGQLGRVTFWMSIASIILGIIGWSLLIGQLHNFFVPPAHH